MNAARPARFLSDWRWFPFALVGLLLAVFAVNAFMVYSAVTTFPGQAGQDGFDLSNAYGRVLEMSARQSALGWRVEVQAGPDGHALLRATDRDGVPLPGVVIEARAMRPLGPKQETALTLRPDGRGRLVSEQALSAGRWTLFVTVQGDETFSTTSQLTMP